MSITPSEGKAGMQISLVVDCASYARSVMTFEREYFTAILNAANCNKTRAAELAGMPYSTFCKKVSGLGLQMRVVRDE